MNAPSLKFSLLLTAFLLAIAVKFWLIWAMEIADATDDPQEYILQILYPANGGLLYPPGVGIVGRFFHDLGVPFRLGIEAAYLMACAFVLRALIAWPWRSALTLGLFLLAAFDPAPTELFNHFYSDPIWLVETLLGLACFVLAFRHPGQLHRLSLYAALGFFGLSMLTRSIAIPLLLAMILFALLALALTLAKFRSKKLKRHLDLLAHGIPTLILGLCLIYGLVCRYNFLAHGYSGLSIIDSAEYKKFYLCLQSVGEPTGDAYFPIDEQRRQLIAQAGPDSKWFVRQLDDCALYKNVGLEHYGKADIPAGWFHWAAFSVTTTDGKYMNAFAFFAQIEEEIATSNRAGIIKVRHILSLPDTRLPIVARAFPTGLRASLHLMADEPSPEAFTAGDRLHVAADFTQALTRRTVIDSPWRDRLWADLALVYAWLYAPAFYLFSLGLLAFLIALIQNWHRLEEFPLTFIARQLCTVLLFVLIAWYALFDASGMPVLARYMILNHVLLYPLFCAYLIDSARLARQDEPFPW